MPPKGPLTPDQLSHVTHARTVLNEARSLNLAASDPATLVMQYERLRSALDDVLRVVDDLSATS